MRLSRYFLPVLREIPAEAKIPSHQLMLRAGLIQQVSAGIYSWMPLGLRVLQRIQDIVNDEQIAAGHLPLLMPTLQPASLWQESGRYEDYGQEMLRIVDRHDRDLLYAPTNEELITEIFRSHVKSYRNLPLTLYHIQWKFRDEIRPRFGIMRGREFLMKDGYNFDIDEKAAIHAYNRHFVSYLRTYERMGLNVIPMRADTGPIGGSHSHEFQVLAETGESEVYFDKSFSNYSIGSSEVDYDDWEQCATIVDQWTKPYARTEETHNPDMFNELVSPDNRQSSRGIEVGQIFYFGTKYSEPMEAFVNNTDGKRVPVHMGSHGIGISRLVAALIEASHDEKGIIWNQSVTPFHAGIINIAPKNKNICKVCDSIYEKLTNSGLEPLYDDTNESPGSKFATMDLIGLPFCINVGPRGMKNGEVELSSRLHGFNYSCTAEEAFNKIKAMYDSIYSTI